MTIRISRLKEVAGRFLVVTDTDDGGRSTFMECWGSNARFDARAVEGSDYLGEALLLAAPYGKYATIFDRQTGKPVGKQRLSI